jgi:transcriptional regulator with XRE-family HTH domain
MTEHMFATVHLTMGYRGKVRKQEEARALRAQGKTLAEIADVLGVSKSSASIWTRDVEFTPQPRRRSAHRRPHRGQIEKLREIDHLNRTGAERIGDLAEREFLLSGVALYAGEGFETDDGDVGMANTDPTILAFFCAWLRHFFEIDESRLRVCLYLHKGLDLEAAEAFWSDLTGIPRSQFIKPYRAEPKGRVRRTKHLLGCPRVYYCSTTIHRAIMGLVRALLSSNSYSGVAQLAEQGAVNAKAAGSSPAPGAKAQLRLISNDEVA